MRVGPLVTGSDLLGWGNDAFTLGATLVGLYIGYRAYQGYRRHQSRSMQFLSIGLFMLTAVAYTSAFVGSVLLRLNVLGSQYEILLELVAGMFQFAGLAFIAYSLHARRDD
jgi:hypothetical protein